MVKILVVVIVGFLPGYYSWFWPSLNIFNKPKNETSDEPTFFWVQEFDGTYHKEPLVGKPKYSANRSDVKYYFFSKYIQNGTLILSDRSLKRTDFSRDKQTVFIIHGWINNWTSPVNREVGGAYLNVVDVNIFVVDWSKIAQMDYITAQFNVKEIGGMVAKFIQYLQQYAGLDLGNTVLVGHSLGAHVAGVTGRALNGKTAHIIGLDPAGPLFFPGIKDNRIDCNCSQFVQVIHTNAGELGILFAVGCADYWPNGGSNQPGCTGIPGSCSHSMSYKFFAESVKTGNFTARSCRYPLLYSTGLYNNSTLSWMGQVEVDTSAEGNFCLDTNGEPPYAQG